MEIETGPASLFIGGLALIALGGCRQVEQAATDVLPVAREQIER